MSSQSLLRLLSGVALAFGAVTVFSGGRALFGDVRERASVDNAVDFVLWFNFIAGFFYMLAGVALFSRWRWGVVLALRLSFWVLFSVFAWRQCASIK